MAPPLTIRNISNNALTLVLVEHFDPVEDDGSPFQMQNVTRSLAAVTNSIGLTNNTTRKAVPQIDAGARPFATREVSIKLPPFTLVPTDIKAVVNKASERLRLTFQTDANEKHQMYCPVPTAATESLVALASNPKQRFTGIFLPDTSFVALFNTSRLDSWMKELPDHAPLGALSIPGTHNSPTCHNAPPSVRCQAVSPPEQLNNGVRFFDIRVQVPEPFDVESDKLNLVHAAFPIALSGNKPFRGLYDDMLRFLREHPSETLVVSLKREGTGKGTDEQLSRILKKHYVDRDPRLWFTEPRVPTLAEARGRIVLLRRFVLDDSLRREWAGRGWGIDAHVWEDNTAHAVCPSGDVCVQDFYEVLERPSIEKKIAFARDHLERSGACDFLPANANAADQNKTKKFPLYVNFLSASNFWKVGTWPEKIAAEVNPAVTAHLGRKHMLDDQGRVKPGNWSTGIVVTDWVGLGGDWDLVRAIVGMNSKISR
ncbi:1-phosphatidylinositol phosphodiesterase [Capronia epimyces CBS 606.96]|uniref:1-phosphatidylinositol phosphodiesterase n=1 Tax=Capronia epimyces CBS 606.96 TaxID=1182542 RepID=W9XBL0_9EURO|nr:1-phosphatidylinositol phosphodiesterase [Capronia epimyces CBS 606.96]EXJ77613.1 1-phosphatidylinositol phosphodiesterase [Capronia epimyces CBS 606.96]